MKPGPRSPTDNCRVHPARAATHVLREIPFCCECYADAIEHSANIDAPTLRKSCFGKPVYDIPPAVFEEMVRRILEFPRARTVSNSETSPHGVSNPSW